MSSPLEVELKKRYGTVYKIHVAESDISVYFKLMSKAEYDAFTELCDGETVTPIAEDYILDHIVVHPSKEVLENLYAGEVTSVVSEVAAKSGFYDIKSFAEELKTRRALTQTLSEQMLAFISKAFPIYTIEQLESKNYRELARLLAIAELMMGQQLNVTGEEEPPAQEPQGNIVSNRKIVASPEEERQLADQARERATRMMHDYKKGVLGR